MLILVLFLVLAGCSGTKPVTVGPVSHRALEAPVPVKVEHAKPKNIVTVTPIMDPRSTSVRNLDEELVRPSVKWIEISLAHGNGQKQQFTCYEGNKVVFFGLVSGAVTDIDEPSNYHPDQPHNHLGLFHCYEKDKDYWSKENHCPMPNAVFFANGHGHAIHSCQARDIRRLGSPASHGCIRVSPTNSAKIYKWVGDVKHYPVPVHIIRL